LINQAVFASLIMVNLAKISEWHSGGQRLDFHDFLMGNSWVTIFCNFQILINTHKVFKPTFNEVNTNGKSNKILSNTHKLQATRSPEPGAQVRFLPGAPFTYIVITSLLVKREGFLLFCNEVYL
jgi:hypothetical protein